MARPSPAQREAAILLSSGLLMEWGKEMQKLLFLDLPTSGHSDSKPTAYLFVNLLLTDIRTELPSLLTIIASPGYENVARRLSCDFEVLDGFLEFLMHSLDDDDESLQSLVMAPDLLLKLRRDVSETMSLTIEFLRDRWDAAVAGAAGLHPDARQADDAPLSLTWDKHDTAIRSDNLIAASIRTLSTWLAEDENENLLKESAGITDVLLGLFTRKETDDTNSGHLEYSITIALQSIIGTTEGNEAFHSNNGWASIWQNIERAIPKLSAAKAQGLDGQFSEAIEATRLLYSVAEKTKIRYAKQEWMTAVKAAASLNLPEGSVSALALEFRTTLYQLSTELLTKAPTNVRKGYDSETRTIATSSRKVVEKFKEEADKRDMVESALEVAVELDALIAADFE